MTLNFKTLLFSFTITIFIIIIFELFFLVAHSLTNLKLFENLHETEQRNRITPSFLSTLKRDIDSNKTKIAIFGGSSASGFASPVYFEKLLRHSLGTDYIIHNYAAPGEPFVNFQAEILKLVMSEYDILIVYAGHNEIWSSLYTKSKISNKIIELPDGSFVNGADAFAKRDNRLSKISRAMQKNVMIPNFNDLIERSRLANLARRIILKGIQPINNGAKPNNELQFYEEKTLIDKFAKNRIVLDFKKELEIISSNLKPKQKFIISTVMANDLYPPISDSVTNSDTLLLEANKIAKSEYAKLVEGKSISKHMVGQLPEGAHKSFLLGIKCIQESSKQSSETNISCRKLLITARQKDAQPLRILVEANKMIGSFDTSGSEVIILDVAKLSETSSNNISLLDLFVDFQHPSTLGHMHISNMLTRIIDVEKSLIKEVKTDCNISIAKDNNLSHGVTFYVEPETIKLATLMNINWLEIFIRKSTSPYQHIYYRDRAHGLLDRLALCNSDYF